MTFQRMAGVVVALLVCAAPAAAQETLGLGVRMAMTPAPTTASTAASNVLSALPSGLIPSYKGSMWTAGVTFYF